MRFAVRVAGPSLAALLFALVALPLATAQDMTPGAPQNLEAEPGDGEVTLTWAAPASDGGSPVTGYEYRHDEGSSVAEETAWTSVGTALTVTVDNLTNDTEYAFEVRALNAAGEGAAAALTATPAHHPTVTVHPEQASYRFAEGASGAGVVFVAHGEPGGSRPSEVFHVSVSTKPIEDGAEPPDDFAALSETISFSPEDFTAAGGTWRARKTVALSIVDDALDEDDEDVPVALERSPGLQQWVSLRQADGTTACGVGGCVAAVTIEDNDGAPSAPQSFSATPGDGEVTLRWKAPAEPGSSAIDRYEYRHAQGASVPPSTAWTDAGTDLTATVDSLTNDTDHAFEVRAVSAAGEGGIAALTVTPAAAATVPSAPRSLEAAPGDGEVTLTWDVPASDGGLAVLGYEFRYAEGTSVPATEAWTSIDRALTVTVASLTNDTEHAFEVRAENTNGPGSASRITATPSPNPVVTVHPVQAAYRFAEGVTAPEVAIIARTAPDARQPSNTFYVEVFSQAVSGGATSPDDYGDLSEAIAFEPDDFSIVDLAWEAQKTIPLAIVDDGADEGDESFEVVLQRTLVAPHWVQLRDADDAHACGLGGCIMTVTIEDNDGVPSAPQNLEAEPGDGEVTLTWASPASNGGSAVTGYEYRHDEGSSVAEETAWTSVGAAMTVMVDSLTNDTEYAFEVRAVNAVGEGAVAALTATPAATALTPMTVPGPPRNLEAEPGDGEVTLTWAAPASNGGSAVTGYEYRHDEGSSVAEETAWTSVGAAMTVMVDSLTNDTEYAFEVRAVNAVGGGAVAALTATPAATALTPMTAPGPPRNLSATPGDGEATLTWRAPARDGGAPIIEYRYRYAEGTSLPASTAWASVGNVLTITVSGLADGQPHVFQVRAVDRVGAGAASETRTTVLELPLLSVEDAQAEERVDSTIDFTVALSRSSTRVISVDYATADGSAKAGEDYERTAGRLVFQVGATEMTVSVPLLRDAKNEDEEKFFLALSNATHARIAKARGTGTIANDGDPLPGAWLVRFGRTIAQQVVDAVSTRLEESPRSHASVAGAHDSGPPAGVRPDEDFIPAAERLRMPGDEVWSEQLVPALPLGSSFHLSSSKPGRGPVVSIWGRAVADGFDAEVDDVRMDGDVTTGLFAADGDWGRVTVGAAVAHSRGEGTFAYTGPRASPQAQGEVASTMTGVYPYARLHLDETASLWALAGAGKGRFTLTEEDGTPLRTDTSLALGALGAVKTLVAADENDGFALSLESDAFWVRTFSEAVRSEASGNLAASAGEATRARLALKGKKSFAIGAGQTLVPSLSVGVRHDGGDAETGTGLEVGAGLAWSDTTRGIAAELSVRRLVTHEAEGFRDWGVSGSARLDGTSSSERGLALSLTSSAGTPATRGTEALLRATTVEAFSGRGTPGSNGRIALEAGYGIPIAGGQLTGAPFAGVGLSESGRDYTLGWRISRQARSGPGDLALTLAATRAEDQNGGASHGAAVTLSLRW